MHVTTIITINTPPGIGVQVYKLLQVYSVKIKINSLVFVRNSKSNLYSQWQQIELMIIDVSSCVLKEMRPIQLCSYRLDSCIKKLFLHAMYACACSRHGKVHSKFNLHLNCRSFIL